jgi:hypothetical protein
VIAGVQEAWIGAVGLAAGGIIGVGGTVLGGRISRKAVDAQIAASSADVKAQIEANSRDVKAQIEAAANASAAQVEAALTTVRDQIAATRLDRIWRRRADVYTDSIRGIRHQQDIRYSQVQNLITGADPRDDPAPVDWKEIEGRLIAYGSSAALEAFIDASKAGLKFLDTWHAIPDMPPGMQRAEMVQQARQQADAAVQLEDKVLDTIRAELQGRPATDPLPPVPRGPLALG